jgi:WD40 repeat protein
MVAFLRNDDELAGLLGHEMGHILTHQGAIRMTRLFREVIGVTSVGDRKDVFDKFNRFLDNARRNPKAFKSDSGEEEPHQYQADQVGLTAVSNAGYSSQAFVGFFDRLAQTKGRTGNFFSDLFGTTKPNEKRLREMHKSQEALPAACREKATSPASSEFPAWQMEVIGYSGLGRKDSLVGLLEKKDLDPPVRSDLNNLRFSPDGKYILAQDDSSIFVFARDSLKILFRIDAPGALPAHFTPDSQSVAFGTAGLRFEKWNIEDEDQSSVHELALPAGCFQTSLSPDGDFVACLNSHLDLSILDIATGEPRFTAAHAFQPVLLYARGVNGQLTAWHSPEKTLGSIHTNFSPDGRYFVAANFQSSIAVDMNTFIRHPLRGSTASMVGGGFAFLDNNRIVAVNSSDPKNSAIVEFLSGKIQKRVALAHQRVIATTSSEYLILSPLQNARAGIMDLDSLKILTGPMKSGALDVFEGHFLVEMPGGEIGIFDLKSQTVEVQASLPRSPLRFFTAAAISSDLNWIAVSTSTRGAVWNGRTGKRMFYLPAFMGAYISPDKKLYADFPHIEKKAREIGILNLAENPGQELVDGVSLADEQGLSQCGPFLLHRKFNSKPGAPVADLILEVRDIHDGRTLWTKESEKDVPAIIAGAECRNLVFGWRADTETARAEMKDDSALQTKLASFSDRKGIVLLETLETETGKVIARMLVDTGKGSIWIARVAILNDWVVVTDLSNRTHLYSISSGQEVGTVFGSSAALSTQAGLLAVGNETGEMDVYSLPAVEKRTHLAFSSPISFVSFSSDGKRLLVLTADQSAYIFDTAILAHGDAKETTAKAQ